MSASDTCAMLRRPAFRWLRVEARDLHCDRPGAGRCRPKEAVVRAYKAFVGGPHSLALLFENQGVVIRIGDGVPCIEQSLGRVREVARNRVVHAQPDVEAHDQPEQLVSAISEAQLRLVWNVKPVLREADLHFIAGVACFIEGNGSFVQKYPKVGEVSQFASVLEVEPLDVDRDRAETDARKQGGAGRYPCDSFGACENRHGVKLGRLSDGCYGDHAHQT